MLKNEVSVAEMRGPLGELCEQCSGENGRDRFEEFKLWLKKVAGLLKFVQTVSVPAISRFAANDRLRAANINWIGENFEKFFLNQIEEDVLAGSVVIYELRNPSLYKPILKQLGNRAEIYLAQFFELIERQAEGQSGTPLIVNDHANIACIRSKKDNKIWAVSASWHGFYSHWRVEAHSVGDPRMWNVGYRVLSRK